ncbi:MAG: ACT domain-containing protein [Methanomicrobiales archaeon]|jgi:prephenate dehydratase|nr:ACT domain-containing protein [Methanomicrobiales archaeon]
MKVGALGPEGTFSHEVAVRINHGEVLLFPTVHRIFAEVAEGSIEEGLVPLENSDAGGVGPTLDALLRHSVSITGEVYFQVHHHLAAFSPPGALTTLYVHPQTHEQCSGIIESLGLPVVHTASNAASAMKLQEDRTAAAIVSRLAAKIYKIPIIREHVENNPHNTTRFIVISKGEGQGTKASIIADPGTDRTGLLHEMLGVFARRRINLSRIESRPAGRGIGTYLFFIDIDLAPGWEGAIAELQKIAFVRWLGAYNRLEVQNGEDA